uniref:Uncharacterized protein n=1 Tax=Arundo donax TaxID=35708 RepID=A0A0A9AFV0_ARUDO
MSTSVSSSAPCLSVITPCASMATTIIGVSFSWNSAHLRLCQP